MDSLGADRYIEGFSDITSPPLSMPASVKPSTAKNDIKQSNLILTTDDTINHNKN